VYKFGVLYEVLNMSTEVKVQVFSVFYLSKSKRS